MKLLKVDTLEQARQKILEHTSPWKPEYKTIALNDIVSRNETFTLSNDVYAPEDIPNFRRSTVDGYAVASRDTAGAGEAIPVFLNLIGEVSMGKPAGFSINGGQCACVPTGGMLPQGADAVVMVEHCEATGSGVAIYDAVASGTGTVEPGEDVKKGELLLRRGTLIRPQEAGALAAAGVSGIPVFLPLKISIISTGDELVPPERSPELGEIRDINTLALKALAVKRGYDVISAQVLPDDEARLEAALNEALVSSDVVLISGGSSQGEKDMTAMLIDRVAKPGVFTHGLALKPGKPTILGWDEKSWTLLAGLPGHPVAAIMVFELLLGWLCDSLFNRPRAFPVPAKITSNVPGDPGRVVCQPVILHFENGTYTAEPVFGKSGMITTLTKADGYIIIDLNREGIKKGEDVMVNLFK